MCNKCQTAVDDGDEKKTKVLEGEMKILNTNQIVDIIIVKKVIRMTKYRKKRHKKESMNETIQNKNKKKKKKKKKKKNKKKK